MKYLNLFLPALTRSFLQSELVTSYCKKEMGGIVATVLCSAVAMDMLMQDFHKIDIWWMLERTDKPPELFSLLLKTFIQQKAQVADAHVSSVHVDAGMLSQKHPQARHSSYSICHCPKV